MFKWIQYVTDILKFTHRVWSKTVVKNTSEKYYIYIQSCEQRCMLFCYFIIIRPTIFYILLSNSKAKNIKARHEQKCSLLTLKCN